MGNISQLHSNPDQATGSGSGDGGGGGNTEGRLVALETRLEYLATKEDVQEIKTNIQEIKTNIQELKTWILGRFIGGIVVVASLVVAIAKLFL